MPAPLHHSIPRSVVLHLLPGVALVAFYVLMAPQVIRWGFPPAFALFLGIPFVLVPVQLGYLLYQARRTTGTWSVASVVPYRAPLRPRTYVLLSIGVFVWFVVVASALALLQPAIVDALFSWLPDWFLDPFPDPDHADRTSRSLLIAYFVVGFAFNGVVGPLVEEMYFRGHLLPAIDRLGVWAVVLNTVLFSLYHFWTPWANLERIGGLLALTYVVWRTRNVYIGIVVHVALNTIGMVALFVAAV